MTSPPMNVSERAVPATEFLLIYTAPGTNPSYRRGVLDTLCYPNGHLIPYSYRRKNIQTHLRAPLRLLIGREAAIIFVDSNRAGSFTYFPLRRAKIRDVSFEQGTIQPPDLKERVNLLLELGPYIEYASSGDERQWHERVKRFDASREITQAKPKYFVIAGDDCFTRSPHSPSCAWEDVVTAVSKSTGFAEALFLRLSHLTHIEGSFDRGPREVERRPQGGRLVYFLRPTKIYRLNLSVFEKAGSSLGDGAVLEIRAVAKDSIEVDQPHQSLVSGLVERSTLITCKRSIENILSTLSIHAERKGVVNKLVNTPSPTIFVRVALSRLKLWLFVGLIFLGGFLVSVDVELVKESWISWAQDWPLTTTYLTKTAGAIALAIAGYVGFRSLPSSGQK